MSIAASYSEAGEALLVSRARQGDHQAFESLVRKHRPSVFHAAIKLTHDPNRAEDLVADAVVRAFLSISSFSGKSKFSTWLYRIMYNRFLDGLRSGKHESVSLEDLREGEEWDLSRVYDGPSALDEVTREEERECLYHAIQELPPMERGLIVDFHCRNMSYEEISQRKKVPLGTIKSRMHRARKRLSRLAWEVDCDDSMALKNTGCAA